MSGAHGEEEAAPVIQLRMQNIMATVNLTTRVDLDKITQSTRNAEYNPKRFQAVIMRIREPRTTALIFASGKMIITGAKSEEDAMNAGKKYAAIVNKWAFRKHDSLILRFRTLQPLAMPASPSVSRRLLSTTLPVVHMSLNYFLG